MAPALGLVRLLSRRVWRVRENGLPKLTIEANRRTLISKTYLSWRSALAAMWETPPKRGMVAFISDNMSRVTFRAAPGGGVAAWSLQEGESHGSMLRKLLARTPQLASAKPNNAKYLSDWLSEIKVGDRLMLVDHERQAHWLTDYSARVGLEVEVIEVVATGLPKIKTRALTDAGDIEVGTGLVITPPNSMRNVWELTADQISYEERDQFITWKKVPRDDAR